ncbi:alpha/beta fold hydrolase [bacterium]|nr:alpha/beta fold hydrolase [bacterium]
MNTLPAPDLPEWLLKQLPFKRYVVPVGALKMHVMEQGPADGYPVLMVHGNPTWGYLYRKVAKALSPYPLRIILPDLIGLGFSDRIRAEEHTLQNHGEWLGDLIGQLKLDKVIFVGQDWGGPIGALALSKHAEIVKGMVILNTVLGPPREGFHATTFHKFARMPLISDFVFRILGFPQVRLSAAQGDKKSISGEVARAYKFPLMGLSKNVAPLALARMVPDSLEHPSIAQLKEVAAFARSFTGPAAIVWGDKDPVLGRALSRVQGVLPNAKLTRTNAGHFLQEEVPEEIAEAVHSIWEQVK